MTAHKPISTSTQIRQSESKRFGRVTLPEFAVGWVIAGGSALSIFGGSRWRAALGFISEFPIIREYVDGALPSARGRAPPPHELPPHDLSPRQRRGQHGCSPLRGKSQGSSLPNWSRRIAVPAHSRVASFAHAALNRAARAANLAGSRTHSPDSPAMPRSPQLRAGSKCSK